MVDLDDLETVDEDVLVTLDDQIHGFEGKYVGKKEIKGSDDDETVYRVYFRPPQSTFGSIPSALWAKIKGSDATKIEEYPEKIPETGLEENVKTSSEVNHSAIPDRKTVLRHKTDESAPYTENKEEQTESKVTTLKKRVNHWKQKAQDAESEKRKTEIESDVEDDTKSDYRPDEYRDRVRT